MKDHSDTIATDGDDLIDDELLVLGVLAIILRFRDDLELALARSAAAPGDDKRLFALEPSMSIH